MLVFPPFPVAILKVHDLLDVIIQDHDYEGTGCRFLPPPDRDTEFIFEVLLGVVNYYKYLILFRHRGIDDASAIRLALSFRRVQAGA